MEDKVKTRTVQVEIEETLQRVIEVEVPLTTAECDIENVAVSIARRMYYDEEIVLDSDDYVCTSFTAKANK